jgi:carboxyl-terminal processing protease
MTSRSRLLVLLVSTPIILLVVIGGVMSRAMSRDDAYTHLQVFDDVVSLVMRNYVEPVDPDRAMHGAMRGLAEALDADSAWLTSKQVEALAGQKEDNKAGVGLELTRQYYLRVIAARDGSPAARAGIRTGDFVRIINDQPTREMSVYTGTHLLRGAPGTTVKLTIIRGNAADPHEIELTREAESGPGVSGRIIRPGIGLVRIAAFTPHTARDVKQQVDTLDRQGATHLIFDLRGTAEGAPALGVAPARLFVKDGVITSRETRGGEKEDLTTESGDGSIALPVTLLVTNGTSQAAEVFAAALAGHKRATLVGEHTLGRAAAQELVRLPDGSGLWLTTARFDAPDGTAIHEKGLTPDIEVAEPDVDFGEEAPATDPILDKALESIAGADAAKAAA